MNVTDELKSLLLNAGADLVGFASILEIDPNFRDNLPFGTIVAVALKPEIVSRIDQGPTKAYVEECQRADALLSSLGNEGHRFLIEKGYKAQSRTTTGPEYADTLSTRLPHKTIATRAGIGWIGKNALLVNKKFGSAIRLGSILTDATLTTGQPVNTSKCGDCSLCVGVCPAQALTGMQWDISSTRDSLVNVFKCRKVARELLTARTGGGITGRTFCGMCIASCPWTQKYLTNQDKCLPSG